MSAVPDAAVTAALRDKVAIALHDLECGDLSCDPMVMGKFYRQADAALEAAAPAIAAQAAAAERETCAQKLGRILATNVVWPQSLADQFYALLDDLKGRT